MAYVTYICGKSIKMFMVSTKFRTETTFENKGTVM